MVHTQRRVAYKLKIGDVLNGKQIIEADRLNYIEIADKNVIRVNIVANVIDKFEGEGEKKYMTFTIDDASGQIRLKVFGDDTDRFKDIGQGHTVMVIGNVRIFNNELYINPEIIKVLDPRYLLVRKLELKEEIKEVNKDEVKAVKEQIIDMIKKEEDNGGIDIDKLVMEIKASPDLINSEIQKLLEDGQAYEPRPGKIRYLG